MLGLLPSYTAMEGKLRKPSVYFKLFSAVTLPYVRMARIKCPLSVSLTDRLGSASAVRVRRIPESATITERWLKQSDAVSISLELP